MISLAKLTRWLTWPAPSSWDRPLGLHLLRHPSEKAQVRSFQNHLAARWYESKNKDLWMHNLKVVWWPSWLFPRQCWAAAREPASTTCHYASKHSRSHSDYMNAFALWWLYLLPPWEKDSVVETSHGMTLNAFVCVHISVLRWKQKVGPLSILAIIGNNTYVTEG